MQQVVDRSVLFGHGLCLQCHHYVRVESLRRVPGVLMFDAESHTVKATFASTTLSQMVYQCCHPSEHASLLELFVPEVRRGWTPNAVVNVMMESFLRPLGGAAGVGADLHLPLNTSSLGITPAMTHVNAQLDVSIQCHAEAKPLLLSRALECLLLQLVTALIPVRERVIGTISPWSAPPRSHAERSSRTDDAFQWSVPSTVVGDDEAPFVRLLLPPQSPRPLTDRPDRMGNSRTQRPASFSTCQTSMTQRCEGSRVQAYHHSISESIRSAQSRTVAHETTLATLSSEFDGTTALNQYVLLMPLGQGKQGKVVLAMDTSCNELRAVKVVHRQRPNNSHAAGGGRPAILQRKPQPLEREISAMKKCRHRNIVALYEVIDDPRVDHTYIVMQYVDKGPIATLDCHGRITPPAWRSATVLFDYLRQLLAGLMYLHQHGVVHRDIKPDNILLGQNDQVYLADFGMAELFDVHDSLSAVVSGTRGTIPFLAPELLVADDAAAAHANAEAVDVWALGMTMYVLYYGELPWAIPTSLPGLVDLVARGEVHFPARDFEAASDASADGPLSSPSSDNTHPAFTSTDGMSADDRFISVLQAMLTKDVATRPSVAALRRSVKAHISDLHSGGDDDTVSVLSPLVNTPSGDESPAMTLAQPSCVLPLYPSFGV